MFRDHWLDAIWCSSRRNSPRRGPETGGCDQRTGWNGNETKLTPANVGSPSFGVLAEVVLDDQVDAQPLVVPNQQITAGPTPGAYQVVYVATEANTIYAISASNGAVLLSRNLGTPVPMPLGCGNNGPNVGINSTPVIDVAAQALYVVAYTLMSGIPTYQVFALNLSDLTDKIAPVTVAASHTLSDGTTYNFNAQFQRSGQRCSSHPALFTPDLPVSAISPPTSRVAGSWDGRPARWLRSRRTR